MCLDGWLGCWAASHVITLKGFGPDQLPPPLFDLALHSVVRATDIKRANYAVISRVWGDVTEIYGSGYGIDWKILIRSEAKLSQILEAARVIVGDATYVWMSCAWISG